MTGELVQEPADKQCYQSHLPFRFLCHFTGGNRGNRGCFPCFSARESLALVLSFVGSRQDQTGNAVNELQLVEVDEQADGDVQQPHVAQKLRLVDR